MRVKKTKTQKNHIPARYLKNIFKTLPNVSESQLASIKPSIDYKTYKTLSKLSGLISQSVIKDLAKETDSFMAMAAELKDDMDFDNLIEETK